MACYCCIYIDNKSTHWNIRKVWGQSVRKGRRQVGKDSRNFFQGRLIRIAPPNKKKKTRKLPSRRLFMRDEFTQSLTGIQMSEDIENGTHPTGVEPRPIVSWFAQDRSRERMCEFGKCSFTFYHRILQKHKWNHGSKAFTESDYSLTSFCYFQFQKELRNHEYSNEFVQFFFCLIKKK